MVFILTHGCVARWVLRGVRADIELVGGLVGIHRRYVFALADVCGLRQAHGMVNVSSFSRGCMHAAHAFVPSCWSMRLRSRRCHIFWDLSQ